MLLALWSGESREIQSLGRKIETWQKNPKRTKHMEAQVPYSGYSLASGPSLLSPPRPLHYIHT